MLTILMGRAKTGKSDRVLETIAALGDESQQILLVPEHASHQAEVDLCRVCGPTASRHAEVLSFRRLSDRVLGLTGGLSQVSLDPGRKAADAAEGTAGGSAGADGIPAAVPEGGVFAADAGPV